MSFTHKHKDLLQHKEKQFLSSKRKNTLENEMDTLATEKINKLKRKENLCLSQKEEEILNFIMKSEVNSDMNVNFRRHETYQKKEIENENGNGNGISDFLKSIYVEYNEKDLETKSNIVIKTIINERNKMKISNETYKKTSNINIEAYKLKSIIGKDEIPRISINENDNLLNISYKNEYISELLSLFIIIDKGINHLRLHKKQATLEGISDYFQRTELRKLEISKLNQLFFIFPGCFNIKWIGKAWRSNGSYSLGSYSGIRNDFFSGVYMVLSFPKDLGSRNYLEIYNKTHISSEVSSFISNFQFDFLETRQENENMNDDANGLLSFNEMSIRRSLFIIHLMSYIRKRQLDEIGTDILNEKAINKEYSLKIDRGYFPLFNLHIPNSLSEIGFGNGSFTTKDFIIQNDITKYVKEYLSNEEKKKVVSEFDSNSRINDEKDKNEKNEKSSQRLRSWKLKSAEVSFSFEDKMKNHIETVEIKKKIIEKTMKNNNFERKLSLLKTVFYIIYEMFKLNNKITITKESVMKKIDETLSIAKTEIEDYLNEVLLVFGQVFYEKSHSELGLVLVFNMDLVVNENEIISNQKIEERIVEYLRNEK